MGVTVEDHEGLLATIREATTPEGATRALDLRASRYQEFLTGARPVAEPDRVLAQAGAGEIVCSRTVKDPVAGSGFAFAERGTHRLKGVPDSWELYAVEPAGA